MKSILYDLYYGGIHPVEDCIPRSPAYKDKAKRLRAIETHFPASWKKSSPRSMNA